MKKNPSLTYKLVSRDPSSSSKIGMTIKHWIRELVEFYQVSDLETFITDFNNQLGRYPSANGFSASNTYRAKIQGDTAIIERHHSDLHKEPVIIYTINYRKEQNDES